MSVDAVTTAIIWSSRYGLYSSRMRRWSTAPSPSSTSSCRRLLRPRNSARSVVHTSSHALIGTLTATAPAIARSTNPPAIVRTSMMTTCLSTNGVEDEQQRVRGGDERQRRRDQRRRREPCAREERRRDGRCCRRQLAGRDRPRLLQRMPPIRVAIRHVVEEVDGARQRAEDRERRRRGGDGVQVEQASAEEQAREQQQVLRPLFGTQRAPDREPTSTKGAPSQRGRQTLAEEEKLRTASASLS